MGAKSCGTTRPRPGPPSAWPTPRPPSRVDSRGGRWGPRAAQVSVPAEGAIAPSAASLTFGNLSEGHAFFDGTLDEVLLHRRALSPDEILQNYCAGFAQ